jgi:hypothetical protein
VWHARWGGGGEPCAKESSGGGSRHRAVVAEEEEAGVEGVTEETDVEWWRRECGASRRGLRVLE